MNNNGKQTLLRLSKTILTGMFAVLLLGGGLYTLLDNLNAYINGETTTGIIVHKKLGGDDVTTYPVVLFQLEDGSKTTQDLDQRFDNYEFYSSIDIIYQKDDIKDVRVNSVFWLYIFPLFVSIFGLPLFIETMTLLNHEYFLFWGTSVPSISDDPLILDA